MEPSTNLMLDMNVDLHDEIMDPIIIDRNGRLISINVHSTGISATSPEVESSATPPSNLISTSARWIPRNSVELHKGSTRKCERCSRQLKYSQESSWDAYFSSESFYSHLQRNLMHDTFISSLICGQNYAGDLPVEHQLQLDASNCHANKEKITHNIATFEKLQNSGIRDTVDKQKTIVRTLEKLLIESLPTPTYTLMMERRLAVLFHAGKKVKESSTLRKQRNQRSIDDVDPDSQSQLNAIAIRTLTCLLEAYDYNDRNFTSIPLLQLRQILAQFQQLSLWNYWSPPQKQPEKLLELSKCATLSIGNDDSDHANDSTEVLKIIDGKSDTFWLSGADSEIVILNVRLQNKDGEDSISSIKIFWHQKSIPDLVEIQYQDTLTERYLTAEKRWINKSNPPDYEEFYFHGVGNTLASSNVRIVLMGDVTTHAEASSLSLNSNNDGDDNDYHVGIKHLLMYTPENGGLHVDSKTAFSTIEKWLMKSVTTPGTSYNIVLEAIRCFKSWTLATGGLSSVLKLVKFLQLASEKKEGGGNDESRDDFLHELSIVGNEFAHAIETFVEKEVSHTADQDGINPKNSTKARVIPAAFDASLSSQGTSIEDSGSQVRTREASYQHGVVDVGISKGKAAWEFLLEQDTANDEMTCFGAAVCPVLVSSYDSSPNLWMLRGYNGNLYSRGRKLNHSIGKVHPRDVVRIEIDMEEGTLRYSINGIDQGVAFTDLAGCVVHPAVSFYGTGKAIKLMKMEVWGNYSSSEMLLSEETKVFLSSLTEYDVEVGYGEFGRGRNLGYETNVTSNNGSATISATSSSICVSGQNRSNSLSVHPPMDGHAFVLYELGREYVQIQGSCTINDDVTIDQLEANGSMIYFSIWGDGTCLWRSSPITKELGDEYSPEEFRVNIAEVYMLELRVNCDGSNQDAHTIWLEPYFTRSPKWECWNCFTENFGSTDTCTLCGEKKDNSLKEGKEKLQLVVESSPEIDRKLNKDTTELVAEKKFATGKASFGLADQAIVKIMRGVAKLCKLKAETTDHSLEKVNLLEQPFSIEPCCETFLTLGQMLGDFLVAEQFTKNEDSCGAIMDILYYNFMWLRDSNISPSEAGLYEEISNRLWNKTKLLQILESLAGIHLSNPLSPNSRERAFEIAKLLNQKGKKGAVGSHPIQITAAKLLVVGISVLYPKPSDRSHILLNLLRSYRRAPFDPNSSRYFALSSMLKCLSSPGEHGILSMPSLRLSRQSPSDLIQASTIYQIVSLILDILCEKFISTLMQNNGDDSSSAIPKPQQDKLFSENSIIEHAVRLLDNYQQVLLAEAIGQAGKIEAEMNRNSKWSLSGYPQSTTRRKAETKDALVRYSSLLLNKCREILELSLPASSAPDADHSTFCNQLKKTPIGNLLPWFLSSLCLLRRQPWLSRPILPVLSRFLQMLDHVCGYIPAIGFSESRLQQIELNNLSQQDEVDDSMPSAQNLFSKLYTGEKDHFEGQIGFHFEAISTFSVVALGRSTNPKVNNGKLCRSHAIRLWDDRTRELLAEINVNGTSSKDGLGYAYETLPASIQLVMGKNYRITSYEYTQSGDPWYKKENHPDEEYDQTLIHINHDCYNAGSVTFPSSKNQMSAAYGVPTFMIEGPNNPRIPIQFSPSYGLTKIGINMMGNYPVNSISINSEADRFVIKNVNVSGKPQWSTVLSSVGFLSGIHRIDFEVSNDKKEMSQQCCFGIAQKGAHSSSFLGQDEHGIGWMPSNGSLWYEGKKLLNYSKRRSLRNGDIVSIKINCDERTFSFSINGEELTIISSSMSSSMSLVMKKFFHPSSPIYISASLHQPGDSCVIRPSGFNSSTFKLHWLHDILKCTASAAGRLAGALIAGNPIDRLEEELSPWLQSNLLSGGISSTKLPSADPEAYLQTSWRAALTAECSRYPEDSSNSGLSILNTLCDEVPKMSNDSSASSIGKESKDEFSKLLSCVDDDQASVSTILIEWLEKAHPDTSILRRFGTFPACERLACASMIHHAPLHLILEAKAVYEDLHGLSENGNKQSEDTSRIPSEDMKCIWKIILNLRHWMIKSKQHYKTREVDEAEIVGKNQSSDVYTNDPDSEEDFEAKISAPLTFDSFCSQIQNRAKFILGLSPAMGGSESNCSSTQDTIALAKLTEKWTTKEETSSRLGPISEQWKMAKNQNKSSVIGVLRAQHEWRTQLNPNINREDDEYEDMMNDRGVEEQRNPLMAVFRACDLYIRNGIGAPPDIMAVMLERRQLRSEIRAFGIQAMHTMLQVLSFPSAIHDVIIFLRPAFRGLTEGEKESRERLKGGHNSVDEEESSSDRITVELENRLSVTHHHQSQGTVRHHYLKGLEGCTAMTLQHVRLAFRGLYNHLLEVLSICKNTMNIQLGRALLCAWSLDFEPEDHEFLLHTGVLTTLHEMISVESDALTASNLFAHAEEDHHTGLDRTHRSNLSVAAYFEQWHPMSKAFVRKGLTTKCVLTKRQVLHHMRSAPFAIVPPIWYVRNKIDGNYADVLYNHTVASLLQVHGDFVDYITNKTSYLSSNTSTLAAKSTKDLQAQYLGFNLKLDDFTTPSYAETPSLWEGKGVLAYTVEFWCYPLSLNKISTIRCNKTCGSLKNMDRFNIEFIDDQLQISIWNNIPRNHRFSYQFRACEWTHVAIVYDSSNRYVHLHVNGIKEERLSYQTMQEVVFSEARFGSRFVHSSSSRSSSSSSIDVAGCFSGYLSDVRIWQQCRSDQNIYLHFQRRLTKDLDNDIDHSDRNERTQLLGYWPLLGPNVSSDTNTCALNQYQKNQLHANLCHCEWKSIQRIVHTLPIFSTLSDLSNEKWTQAQRGITKFQAFFRRHNKTNYSELSKLCVEKMGELDSLHEITTQYHQGLHSDDDEMIFSTNQLSHNNLSDLTRMLSVNLISTKTKTKQHPLLKEFAFEIYRKKFQNCAWTLLQYICTITTCGIEERRFFESKMSAEKAKKIRKSKLTSTSSVGSSSSNAEEEPRPRLDSEKASAVAQSAADHADLDEPTLSTLWFSMELHRKVFDILEYEITEFTILLNETQGILNSSSTAASTSASSQSQPLSSGRIMMPRSVSTPVIAQPSSSRIRGIGNFGQPKTIRSKGAEFGSGLEADEIEQRLYSIILYTYGQSNTRPFQLFLCRPTIIQQWIKLLQIGSPRIQRLVQFCLRSVVSLLHPKEELEIGQVLGCSRSAFVDLFLDRIASSVCGSSNIITRQHSHHFNLNTTSESLANPLGFRSGNIQLIAAAESIALLRLLLLDGKWNETVWINLSNVIKSAATLLERRQAASSSDTNDTDDDDNIRYRAVIVRAVAALSVLGAHTDCTRIGGKVRVTAHENDTLLGKTHGSSSSATIITDTIATLVELDSRSMTAQVMFDASDEDADPMHNIQQVSLASISPIDEIRLTDAAIRNPSEILKLILMFISIPAASLCKRSVNTNEIVDDELWFAQVQSKAMLALQSILRLVDQPKFGADNQSANDRSIPQALLQTALVPIHLSSFVGLSYLQERGRSLLCRIIESTSSSTFGKNMFQKLNEPPAGTEYNELGGETIEEIVMESEEQKRRRQIAAAFVEMGFEIDLGIAALEQNRDDMTSAIDWLMSPAAAAYRIQSQANGSSTTADSSSSATGSSSPSNRDSRSREEKAKELQNICGMPQFFILLVLEMFHDDPDQTMGWLMDRQFRYAEYLDTYQDEMHVEEHYQLCDAAALEDCNKNTTPLFLDPVRSSSSAAANSSNRRNRSSASRSGNLENGRDSDVNDRDTLAGGVRGEPELKVSRIVTPRPVNSGVSSSNSQQSEWYELEPDYLPQHIVLVVKDQVGEIDRLSCVGCAGTVICTRKNQVLLRFLDVESGMGISEWHLPQNLRRITHIYGEPMDGKIALNNAALPTERALAIHYARRGVVAILHSVCHDDLQKIKLNQLIEEFGGAQKLVDFVKLVAASEGIFDQASSGSSSSSLSPSMSNEKSPSSATTTSSSMNDGNSDLMPKLRQFLLQALRLESTNERTYSSACEVEEEQKEVDPQRNGNSRMISSVLVNECVSHFVKSTQMTLSEPGNDGDNTRDVTNPPHEYQSIHPYYGQCDYQQKIHLPGACAIKIVFDARCRLGNETSLTFYSDAALSNQIVQFKGRLEVNFASFIHPSNVCWLRFHAKETDVDKDYGYGFRLGVRALPQISWIDEKQVFQTPSLDWACWVLRFLLNHAIEFLEKPGAVHNHQVYRALVRYLRSPGAPLKDQIITLLVQLLSSPEQFPVNNIPDLKDLIAIADLVLAKAQEIKRSKSCSTVLPSRLLQLIELSMRAYSAQAFFVKTLEKIPEHQQPINADTIIKSAASSSPSTLRNLLHDSIQWMNYLLLTAGAASISAAGSANTNSSSPEQSLSPQQLKIISDFTLRRSLVLETDHPHVVDTDKDNNTKCFTGVVEFPAAHMLRVWFDPRCSISSQQVFILRTSAPTDEQEKKDEEKEDKEEEEGTDHAFCHQYGGPDRGDAILPWPSACVVIPGNKLFYSLRDNQEGKIDVTEKNTGCYGVALTVQGFTREEKVVLLDSQLNPAQNDPHKINRLLKEWTPTMDGQLVDWVNAEVDKQNVAQSNSATTPSASVSPVIQSFDLMPHQIHIRPQLDVLKCSHLLECSAESLQLRFACLRAFNKALQGCLEFFDLSQIEHSWTLGSQLRQLGHCVFHDVKNRLVESAIEATWASPEELGGNGSPARITLDRIKAVESKEDRNVEPSVSECFFAQAFRQLRHVHNCQFRRKIDNKGRLFSVKFLGEEGVDWGGVYRDGANSIVDSLFSKHFHLLLLCPNGQHDTGLNRGMYLPNPMCKSPIAIQMFEFMGKLLGISFRTKADFPFLLPSLVWKQCVGQVIDRQDLEAVDEMFVQMLLGIRNCTQDGIHDDQQFQAAFSSLDLAFTTNSASGKVIELCPHGKSKTVTFENRLEYCDLAENFRLTESSLQIQAIHRGLLAVVPAQILRLLTWQEMELMTCGSPRIDVEVWKKHTRYDGYHESDETVQLFWKVLSSFSDEQRADFVRFAWGRSRLPRGRWSQPFKLIKKGGRNATRSLPVAHTCFFSVELPPYTTEDKMRKMLVATINFGLGGILMA